MKHKRGQVRGRGTGISAAIEQREDKAWDEAIAAAAICATKHKASNWVVDGILALKREVAK